MVRGIRGQFVEIDVRIVLRGRRIVATGETIVISIVSRQFVAQQHQQV